jgi:hypothetical protein
MFSISLVQSKGTQGPVIYSVSWGDARNAYGVPDLSEPVLHEAEPGPGPVHDGGPLGKDGKLLAASQPGLVPAHNLFTDTLCADPNS